MGKMKKDPENRTRRRVKMKMETMKMKMKRKSNHQFSPIFEVSRNEVRDQYLKDEIKNEYVKFLIIILLINY